MKRIILLISFLTLTLSANVQADTITVTNLTSSANIAVHLASLGDVTGGSIYTLYISGSPYSAFCVEDVLSPNNFPVAYDLLPITDTRQLQAAYVAAHYSGTAAQLAIWNLWLDNDNSVSSSVHDGVGDVWYNGSDFSLLSTANSIIAEALKINPTSSYGWMLAHSPAPGGASNFQDYLVHYPVPEPATMLLLGLGLIGLAGLGRKKLA